MNAGFNKKNVDLHCINPLIYLQQYLDAERYSDTEDSPYTEAIEAMSERGIFQGYEDGSFRPENPINRAEALKILFEASNTPLETNYSNYLFTDTDSSQWYYPYVASSQIQGYVQGYSDGSFHPAGNITRAEFLKIVLKFFNIDENSYDYDSTSKYGDISYSAWYYPYIMRSE
ncbi:MAG: S-layer homology domain-containing protein [Patescibacteria group bacterium]|nr:S-layer homology domain-containing protein [Patescibacteria group bacterium]